ncbi:RNA polymerase sigma factor [Paenibacillus larvae]
MLTDEELVEEIRRGTQSSMELLIQRHYPMIFAYLYRMTGEYHSACDLTQDTFVKMVRYLPNYRGEGKFRSWLLCIGVNTARDYFRSTVYSNYSKSGEIEDTIPSNDKSPLELVSYRMESEEVKKTVLRLPDYQKEAIILRYYHDCSIKEIAELTNAGESAVKSRLYQGVQKLKKWLGKEHNDEQISKNV